MNIQQLKNLMNQSLSLHREGKFVEAEKGYLQYLHQVGSFDAIHMLGVIANARGDYHRANELIRLALTLNPKNPSVYNNLGSTYLNAKDYGKAIIMFDKALTLKPDYPEAYNNKGKALLQSGEYVSALNCFDQAIKLRPDYADAHLEKGVCLDKLDRHAEAEVCYKHVISLEPNALRAHKNLGVHYQHLGRFDEALSCYKKALELFPRQTDLFRSIVDVSGESLTEADLIHIETVFDKEKDHKLRLEIGYALAHGYERVKQTDKFFHFLNLASGLKRQTYTYSTEKVKTQFSLFKSTVTTAFLKQMSSSGLDNSRPVFVVGMPRSGTTLVEQILASHSEVYGSGELPFLYLGLKKSFAINSDAELCAALRKEGAERKLQEAGEYYCNKLAEINSDSTFVVDKMPGNFVYLGFIKAMLPKAKIIHISRNPMDNCFSLYKNYFVDELHFSYNQTELGEYYLLYEDLMSYWETFNFDDIYHVQYEDIIADQDGESRKLIAYLGLPWEEACLNFHKSKRMVKTASYAQVTKPIYKNSVDAWRKYDKYLHPLIKILHPVDNM
ncbi:MAG: sulfotransferase [Desulfobulbaceae bacterium]|nr:sulfotransferase [Desulfobulbaceae bacterium]